MNRFIKNLAAGLALALAPGLQALASSHRESPLASNDPQADNTDLYAFRSPCDSNKIVIIANYIPFQLPNGGPNWYQFGTGVRYEIHIKNRATIGGGNGDDITYRFTFQQVNEDSTTFFNIRLGKQNLKTTYTCERSLDGGVTFTAIKTGGIVPPPNIGPRSITGAAGLGAASYGALMNAAVSTTSTGETVFAGPSDDPFFVDLGGAFDLGGFRAQGRDGLAKYNTHSIVLEIPVTTLQASGQTLAQKTSILDPNYVIGVWASASRQTITTLGSNGAGPSGSGSWVQVSRLGMPLTNEAITPIGAKDRWNNTNPYTNDLQFAQYFKNPELALYMDNSQFGPAVPGLTALRIQSASRPDVLAGGFDFRNGRPGLWPLKGSTLLAGTALAPGPINPGGGFGDILLPDNASPRAVDILPIFYTGVPNLPPYQLATGKATIGTGGVNPLAAGKPFINNFLPTLGDMLRLNMAVPATPRTSADFSSLGIISAAVLGLTDARFNSSAALQFIPNMDGFPNGRRLEDDVTTIELQAVGGVALAAIGLWYDDYTGTGSPVTTQLGNVLGFNAGVTKNDTSFQACMPYVQQPWAGFTGADFSGPVNAPSLTVSPLGLAGADALLVAYPNPFRNSLSFRYKIAQPGQVAIEVADISGRTIASVTNGRQQAGEHTASFNSATLPAGTYFARITINGEAVQSVKLTKRD